MHRVPPAASAGMGSSLRGSCPHALVAMLACVRRGHLQRRESGGAHGSPDPDAGGAFARGGEAVRRQRGAVRRMFDAVSPRYDLLNRLLSLGLDGRWRRRCARELRLGPGDSFLDVACGTADLALAVGREAGTRRLVGIDFAARMLDRARKKGADRRVNSLFLSKAAAEALPFLPGSFDAAGIAFGIRNVPDRIGALREMAAAVRPGGKVAVLEFTSGDLGPLGFPLRLYSRHLLPRVGGLLSDGAAYAYLDRSVRFFPAPELFVQEMKEAGLEDVRCHHLRPAPTWLFVGTVPSGRGSAFPGVSARGK
jgi:demethylmenaquinone methyltransferase/2-methoxy-6-polyprenyl-1,4-benzoquinol methylase